MLDLDVLNGIFNKSRAEILKVLKEAEKYIKPKDEAVAKVLGMSQAEKIYIIRITIEAYELLAEKKKEAELELQNKRLIIKENNKDDKADKKSEEYEDREGKKETKGKSVERELGDETKEEKRNKGKEKDEEVDREPTQNKSKSREEKGDKKVSQAALELEAKKIAITLTETGTIDYGNEEIQEQIKNTITEAREKKEGKKDESEPNREEEEMRPSIEKEEYQIKQGLESSIHAPQNKVQQNEVNRDKEEIIKKIKVNKDMTTRDKGKEAGQERLKEHKGEGYQTFVLWDLPQDYSKYQISKLVERYGRIVKIDWKRMSRGKIAKILLECKTKEDQKKLEETWSIPLELGTTTRVSYGEEAYNIKENRREHKAIIRGVPTNAKEVLLLRQLAKIDARAVHIPFNSNYNRKRTATIYFDSEKSKLNAIRQTVYYYNSRLEWTYTTENKEEKEVRRPFLHRHYEYKGKERKEEGNDKDESKEGENNRTTRKRKENNIEEEKEKREYSTNTLLLDILDRIKKIEEKELGAEAPNRS